MNSVSHKKIYIEGNIGSGKTTFLHNLKKYINNLAEYGIDASIVYEPVDLWLQTKDIDGKNILEKFYEDQERWSYLFQMNSFISRIKVIDEELNKPKLCDFEGQPLNKIVFIERSIFTDKNCFAKLCYENGKMTQLEYDTYCKWNNWLSEQFNAKADGYIYLKCDPKENSNRIKSRSREGEEGIPISYLEQLHEKHEVWMTKEKEENIPVLDINAMENLKNEDKMYEVYQEIVKFINTL